MRRRSPDMPEDLPLSALSPVDVLCYVSAWRPPASDRDRELSRWTTWDQYLETWSLVRAAYMASTLPKERLFVDRVLRYRARHGREALEHARYEDITDGD
jgi:hypothetical protein